MNVQRPKQPLSMCYYPLVATCTHGTCTGCLTPRAAHSRRRPRSSGPRPPSARPRSKRREAPQRPSAWSKCACTAAQAGCAIGQRRAPALTRLRGPARPPCARPYLSGVAIAPAKLNQCGRTKSFFNDLGLRRVFSDLFSDEQRIYCCTVAVLVPSNRRHRILLRVVRVRV